MEQTHDLSELLLFCPAEYRPTVADTGLPPLVAGVWRGTIAFLFVEQLGAVYCENRTKRMSRDSDVKTDDIYTYHSELNY
jgi:hypothetical protein